MRSLRVARASRPAHDVLRRTPLRGQLHSVFDRAINIKIEVPHGAPSLITILPSHTPLTPNGVSLHPDDVVTRGFRSIDLSPTLPVHVNSSSEVIIGDALRIDLRGCSLWSPTLSPFANVSVKAAHALLCDWVRHERSVLSRIEGGFAPLLLSHCDCTPTPAAYTNQPLLHTAAPLIEGICSAPPDRPLDEANVVALMGLGGGLTPSGDDFLVGLSATLTATGHPLATFLAPLGSHFARRTTDVSAAFLLHASRREYSELLHEALAALLTGARVSESLHRLLSFGSSSGADTLLGMRSGLAMAETQGRAQ